MLNLLFKTKLFSFSLIFGFIAALLFNTVAQAQCEPTSDNCLDILKGTAGIGDGSIEQILINILNASLSLLFLVVMGFLIYGGYFWMTSMGNEERIKKSKQILTSAVVGLIVVLLSISIVNFVSDAIGVTPQNMPEDTGLFTGTLSEALTGIINAALTLVGVIALGTMVYGGFRWMTAAGSEEQVGEAKKILTAGVIGLIIIIISWAIVNFVITAVNGA